MILLSFVGIVVTLAWLASLVDAARIPDAQWKVTRRGSRVLWVLVIVILGPLGSVLYAMFAAAPTPKIWKA